MGTILDSLTGGTLLGGVAGGLLLDPPQRRENRPRAACRRCGCWISARRAVTGPDGLLWCPTCCNGTQPFTPAPPT